MCRLGCHCIVASMWLQCGFIAALSWHMLVQVLNTCFSCPRMFVSCSSAIAMINGAINLEAQAGAPQGLQGQAAAPQARGQGHAPELLADVEAELLVFLRSGVQCAGFCWRYVCAPLFGRSVDPNRRDKFLRTVLDVLDGNDIATLAHLRSARFKFVKLGEGCSAQFHSICADVHGCALCVQGLSGGVIAFIQDAFGVLEKERCTERPEVVAAGGADKGAERPDEELSDDRLQRIFTKSMRCADKVKVVHIDMLKVLSDLGLAAHFPTDLWPQANAVRKLATRIKTLKCLGQEQVFVYSDMREFLPAACAEYQPVWLDSDGTASESGKIKSNSRLDFAWWLLAWDRYALAAAATGQMSFALAMQHKAIVADIAADAIVEGTSTLVAVIYDDLMRRASVLLEVACHLLCASARLPGRAGKASVATSGLLSTSRTTLRVSSRLSCGMQMPLTKAL